MSNAIQRLTCGVRRAAYGVPVRRAAYGVPVRRAAYGVPVRRAACGVLLSASGLWPGAMYAQDGGLPLGTAAPSAVLQTLDGKTVDLAKVAKGPAVIEFWATWCESCDHLLPAMQRAHATYGKRVTFIAVAVSVNQSPRRVQLHVAKHKVPGVQLYDTKGEATGKWDVPATSHVVVLDRRGRVVYTGVGGDQDVDAAIRKALQAG